MLLLQQKTSMRKQASRGMYFPRVDTLDGHFFGPIVWCNECELSYSNVQIMLVGSRLLHNSRRFSGGICFLVKRVTVKVGNNTKNSKCDQQRSVVEFLK